MYGFVYRINIKPERAGERGIPKLPVAEALVTVRGIAGDFNRYRHEKKNDDPDKALLILPHETIQDLIVEGWSILPGDLGENITSRGIPYSEFALGKLYRIGKDVEIQISQVCTPCSNLAVLPYVGEEKVTEFMRVLLGRRGWYARVLKEGRIHRGDSIDDVVK